MYVLTALCVVISSTALPVVNEGVTNRIMLIRTFLAHYQTSQLCVALIGKTDDEEYTC